MVLAIWVAAQVGEFYLNIPVLVGIFVAAILAVLFRLMRRAVIADLRDGPILRAFIIVRFSVAPAVFLLAIFSAIAWGFRLAISDTLWVATLYALVYGFQAILITRCAFELALGARGAHREQPLDS